MLEPREADLPVLFLVLVVLPLVTYILLGKWSEAAKKKARISMLSQLAADEALRVEAVPLPEVAAVVSSPKVGFYECAKCFAPATTRCSRCKSVRYCSGKCQIIHWRQGHKQECQEWQNRSHKLFSCRNSAPVWPSVDNPKQFLGKDIDESLHSDFLPGLSSDASLTTADTLHHSSSERKLSNSDNQASDHLKIGSPRSDVTVASAFEDTMNYATDNPAKCRGTLFTGLSYKDTPLRHELGSENFTSSMEVHRPEDTSSPIYGHYPTALRNAKHQSDILTAETAKILKPSCSYGNSGYVINEYGNDLKFTLEDEFYPVSEAVDLDPSTDVLLGRENIMFKRPPYTLGPATPQQPAEKMPRDYRSRGLEKNDCMDNESRVSVASAPTCKPLQNCNEISNNGGLNIVGLKKASKVNKWNLGGFISDCNEIKMLFPYEDLVKFFQCEIWGISPRGLLNCGNSCYANAVLQCLTCTKPLMIYLLRKSHSKTCRVRDWCLMCELEQHVLMLREGGGPLSPSRILSNMRNIGCRMGGGNQEDAHEFLRLLVMSMQSICLEGVGGEKEVNPRLQETTLIQQIFGGRLKSKVKCLRCHVESERYENIMDLTLEIHGWVESLEDALTQFTAPEDLDGENMYRCGRCSEYVKARKQLSVYEVPNILTIVLKRFQTGKYGKINKCVTFPDMLDMIPFVTGTADSPPLYMLYGVIVHLDTLNASFSGHYISYVKDVQGTWFKIDDSEVQAVSLHEVMSEGAYMLFYSRSFPRPPRAYIEKASLQASTKLAASKSQKVSRHEQHKVSGASVIQSTRNGENSFRDSSILPREETFADSSSMDFSDATSSDWSLFTSSDESSFTTESTRDSFSTVDHGDSAGLDPISSLFAPPFYMPEYPNNHPISCTKLFPSRPQTRFFSEKKGLVLDSPSPTHPPSSVHRGRVVEQVEGHNCNMYGRYGSNPKDDFVQDSGDWGL